MEKGRDGIGVFGALPPFIFGGVDHCIPIIAANPPNKYILIRMVTASRAWQSCTGLITGPQTEAHCLSLYIEVYQGKEYHVDSYPCHKFNGTVP
jgi:hypothetical protein